MHYELMVTARKALAAEFESRYPIAFENVDFRPPNHGEMWRKPSLHHWIASAVTTLAWFR